MSLSTYSCMTMSHMDSMTICSLSISLVNPTQSPLRIRRRIYGMNYYAGSFTCSNIITHAHHCIHIECVIHSQHNRLSFFALLSPHFTPTHSLCFSVESRPLFLFFFLKQLHSLCVRQWARRKVVNLGVTIRDQLPFLSYPTFPWATNNNNNTTNPLIDKFSLLPLSVLFLWNPTMPKALTLFNMTMTQQQQQPMPSIHKVNKGLATLQWTTQS